MKISVFGIGYVGLVQAAVLSDAGHHVVCIDVDEKKIVNLKKGVIPIYEPGLEKLVEENTKAGRLIFTTEPKEGVEFSEIQFIAVGTPPDEDGSADLQHVLEVAGTIATFMNDKKLIINKSTVPVGTATKVANKVESILQSRGVNIEFHVVSNPEFLKEGSAVSDCARPDRIVIGTDNDYARGKMRELYAPFNRNHEKIIFMDVASSELTKYAANCMLATKISFMNEMANIAEKTGADIEQVRKGIGADERIGYHFIYPGCGYGGSCFTKDVQALLHKADQIDYKARILEAVEQVNFDQKRVIFGKIKKYYKGVLGGKTIAIWGLSFKPKTDDMRDAPSRVLIESLWSEGAKVQAYDPRAMKECQRIYGLRNDLVLSGTAESALKGADALVLVTEWQEFKAPDFSSVKRSLKRPVIFDGRNLYDPAKMREMGFEYYSIGR